MLDEVFGSQSRLDNELWLKAICEKANFVFNSHTLRMKVFEAANIKFHVPGGN